MIDLTTPFSVQVTENTTVGLVAVAVFTTTADSSNVRTHVMLTQTGGVGTIYWSFESAVTTSRYMGILPDQYPLIVACTPAQTIYLISDMAAQTYTANAIKVT